MILCKTRFQQIFPLRTFAGSIPFLLLNQVILVICPVFLGFSFANQLGWKNGKFCWKKKACEKITALINQGLTQDLTEQYQNLFIGPNELLAPPWGSVYLDPECVIFGIQLLALRDFLKRHQIAFQAQQDEPEDHIGLMLMLAAYLAETRPHLLVEFLSQHFIDLGATLSH